MDFSDIVSLDIEATGLDPAKDRIVSLGVYSGFVHVEERSTFKLLCNPGVLMSEDVIAVHGITNEQVKDSPPFSQFAHELLGFLEGCDIVGFNLKNFDIPLLWEEFYRCGIEWDLSDIAIIDAGNIFKKEELRTLEAALEFYCNAPHLDSHSALGDAIATARVFEAQVSKYAGLQDMTPEEIAQYSNLDRLPRVDLAGKIRISSEGDYVYGLKSKEGIRIKDDLGFADWMLSKDFSANTKFHLRQILQDIDNQQHGTKMLDFGSNPSNDGCPF